MAGLSSAGMDSFLKKGRGPMDTAAPKKDPMEDLFGGEAENEEVQEEDEGMEDPLEKSLEQAGYNPTPEQLDQIKGILDSGTGGETPDMELGTEEASPLPAPSKPKSKMDKLFQ
jgi:hypothetical protein